MDFVHVKLVEVMECDAGPQLSHFVTNCHGGTEPGIRVGNSPAQNLLVFSNVLSKGYIQQQEGVQVSY